MSLFKNCGLFWNADDVYFGRQGGRGVNRGALRGVAEKTPSVEVDFRDQIGIYALYADFDLVYVGQVGAGDGQRLLARLRQHSQKDFKGRWNRFSWFGLRSVLAGGELSNENTTFHPSRAQVLNHIEGIILQFAEPALNGQEGKFCGEVARYRQFRDARLGQRPCDMLQALYEDKFPTG